MSIVSFDIFDTLLVRAVAEPTALFLLLGRRLSQAGRIAVSSEAFALARIEAERVARRNVGEVTLRVIHSELAAAIGVSSSAGESIAQEELALEAQLLRVLPGAGDLLAKSRSQTGGSIVFCSDMYLPSAFLIEQLRRFDLWRAGDRLYVSCEHGCDKASGRLYAKLLDEHDEDDALHHGNDAHADVRRARNAGWRAMHLPHGNLRRYENILAGGAWASEGLSAAMAGAARLSRLTLATQNSTTETSAEEDVVGSIATGVGAPLLTAFVLWVLREAKTRQIRRLYFLARDGEILLEIAKRLIPKLGLEDHFDLRYLVCSRQTIAAANVDASGGTIIESYFKQEGLLDATSWALVDVGWYGSIQTSMATILRGTQGPEPIGFYFGLRERLAANQGQMFGYFFDDQARTGYSNGDTRELILLIEPLCNASHGPVEKYIIRDDRVVPVLGPARPSKFAATVTSAILNFVENLVLDRDLVNPYADVRPVLREVIDAFWFAPTRREALIWGSQRHESDPSGAMGALLATPCGMRELATSFVLGKAPIPHVDAWSAGSLWATPWPLRMLIRLGMALNLPRRTERWLGMRRHLALRALALHLFSARSLKGAMQAMKSASSSAATQAPEPRVVGP